MNDYPQWPSHAFRAMGSGITLWLESEPSAFEEACDTVERLFATNEAALSRFRPDSELSQLNRQTGTWVPVSDLLWTTLEDALALARLSDGLFDPTLLNALEAAGYDQSYELVAPATSLVASPASLPGGGRWSDVEMNAEHRSVRLPPAVRVDLGGIAKGSTAQQAVRLLRQWGPCLMDAGGDLSAGAAPDGYPGWPVGIAGPSDGSGDAPADLASLWLADATLATSGVDFRRWRMGGRDAHHIIDPATGLPSMTDLLTVTVLAADAADAEAWSTAGLVMGMARAREALETIEAPASLVGTDGRVVFTAAMRPFVGAIT